MILQKTKRSDGFKMVVLWGAMALSLPSIAADTSATKAPAFIAETTAEKELQASVEASGGKLIYGGVLFNTTNPDTNERLLGWGDVLNPEISNAPFLHEDKPMLIGYISEADIDLYAISFNIKPSFFNKNKRCKKSYWISNNEVVSSIFQKIDNNIGMVSVGNVFDKPSFQLLSSSDTIELELCGKRYPAPDNIRQVMREIDKLS